MLQVGVKTTFLQDHLMKLGHGFISAQDIHNLRNKISREANGTKTDEELLVDELQDILDNDPTASVTIKTSDDGMLQLLFFATTDMKHLHNKYPEVLLVDGTYRVNKLRMPLYCFMVEDAHGMGHPVAYCFAANEKRDNIHAAFMSLSSCMDLDKTKVVVIDKDMNELSACNEFLPHASVQLCKFHVLQAITLRLKRYPDSDKILRHVQQCIHSRSEESFHQCLNDMRDSAPADFFDYFEKNWLACADYWVSYITDQFPNLGNTTNNRIESHNQKIKTVLDKHMSLGAAVKNLLLLKRIKKCTAEHKNFEASMKVAYRNTTDKTETKIVQTLTPYASSIVLKELSAAKELQKKGVSVNGDCACPMKTAMLLPCRHTFLRRLLGNECIFSTSDVADRWLLSYSRAVANNSLPSRKKRKREPEMPENGSNKRRILDRNEKYREAMALFQEMADITSDIGMREFCVKMDQIKELRSIWRSGNEATILCLDAKKDTPNHQDQDDVDV